MATHRSLACIREIAVQMRRASLLQKPALAEEMGEALLDWCEDAERRLQQLERQHVQT